MMQSTASVQGLLVREERFGPLIWSGTKKAYYIQNRMIDRNFLGGRGRRFVDVISESALGEDLAWLGMGQGMEVIDHESRLPLSGPLEFYFDYTWLCNLAKARCGLEGFCYAAQFLGPTTMAQTEVQKVMRELRQWGVMRVHLAGGEPMLRVKDLENYLAAAEDNGLWTSINTNGTMLDARRMDVLLSHELKSLSISMDGYDERSFAQVRGPGLFDRVAKNVTYAVRRRNESGSRMRIAIKPTFDGKVERTHLKRLVDMSIGLGVDTIKLANVERCQRHPSGHYAGQRDSYYKTLEAIGELRNEYSDQIDVTVVNNPLLGCAPIGVPGLTGCIGGQELLALNPNGEVTPCLIHPRPLGHPLADGMSLREFWETSEALAQFRNELAIGHRCTSCALHSQCRGGSTVRRLSAGGELDADGVSGRFDKFVDEFCPADYIAAHPGISFPSSTTVETPNGFFREVSVKHSL